MMTHFSISWSKVGACAALLLSTSLSCAGGDGGQGIQAPPAGAALAKSDKPRDVTPSVSSPDQATLGSDNQAFAFDLYRVLRAQEGNLFLSPYSISVALAMTYAGANGSTARQIADALHFELEPSTLHAAFNAADLELAMRGGTAKGKDNQPFRLHIVNQTWGQKGFRFLPTFLDTLAESYGAGLFLLDFSADPERARTTINDWVSQQTEKRIQDLIRRGLITGDTQLVLTNAIYFNAAWHLPFDAANTKDGSFLTPSGGVNVKMMHQTGALRYTEGNGYQAVELPYDEEAITFVAILPAAGRFEEIESAIDEAYLQDVVTGLSERSTTVTLPRFEYESPIDLGGPLKTLGMLDAFQAGDADFSGIDGARDLFVQAVVHKAFIAVDEAGTEAAAATAVIIGKVSAPEPAAITLDRPFLFAIIDRPTGQILFLGRVVDPSAH
jgi:serpin B